MSNVDAQRKEQYEQQRAREAFDAPTSTDENATAAAGETQPSSDGANGLLS